MSNPTANNGRPESIFKHSKFKFEAHSALPDAKLNTYNQKPQKPTLEIVPVNNEWHFKVYTNSQSDTKNNGVIQAAMDAKTYFTVMAAVSKVGDALFTKLVNGDEVVNGLNAVAFDNRGFSFMGGKRSPEPHTLSTVMVGIDDIGIYLSVRAKGRPECNFYMNSAEFHNIKARTGTTSHSGGQFESALYALGISEAYIQIGATINKDHFISWPEMKAIKEQNKQNFNGGNRGQHGAQGQQSHAPKNYAPQQSTSSSLFDDDIPM